VPAASAKAQGSGIKADDLFELKSFRAPQTRWVRKVKAGKLSGQEQAVPKPFAELSRFNLKSLAEKVRFTSSTSKGLEKFSNPFFCAFSFYRRRSCRLSRRSYRYCAPSGRGTG
jgi:hypothetical protein